MTDDDNQKKRHTSWEEMKRRNLSPEKIAQIKEQAQRDVDKWESGEVDPRNAQRAAPGRREEIDEKLGIKKLTLRLKTETVDNLARQAEDEGVMLGALLRRILEEHVDEHQNPVS